MSSEYGGYARNGGANSKEVGQGAKLLIFHGIILHVECATGISKDDISHCKKVFKESILIYS